MARVKAARLVSVLLVWLAIAQVSTRPARRGGKSVRCGLVGQAAHAPTPPNTPPRPTPSQAQDTSAVTPRSVLKSTGYTTVVGEPATPSMHSCKQAALHGCLLYSQACPAALLPPPTPPTVPLTIPPSHNPVNPDSKINSLPSSVEWGTAGIGALQCNISSSNDKSSPTCPATGG
jgi:hypothetical protein